MQIINGLLKNNSSNIDKSLILDYLVKNEDFFINILDRFNNNYCKIPNSISYYPFINNNEIDSLIAHTDNGYFYPLIKDQYIEEASSYITNNITKVFSIYGYLKTMKQVIKKIDKPYRYKNEYFIMKLMKNDFKKNDKQIEGYYCTMGNTSHFEKSKDLQFLYHKEEVYTNNSYYPYNVEMIAYKKLLKTKLNYIVFTKDENNIAVSKSNINGESPGYYQLGGIYTKKEYRNKGLSRLCVSCLIADAFLNSNKNNMILYVKKENLPAIKLYQRLGFTILDESMLCYY